MARTVLRGDRRSNAAVLPDTGYNAAILAHCVGVDHVTTVEVDPGVADTAMRNLTMADYPVAVVCGDGAMGYAAGAPYDRVLATCAVLGEVPLPGSSRPGRVGWFMPMRAQRIGHLPDDPDGDPDVITTTTLSPAELRHTVLVFDGSFAIGLRVPKCRTWYEIDKERGYWHTLGFDDAESGSWAIVNADPNEPDIVIKQWGPRRLWDEVELAYRWWVDRGQPTHDRFGISVLPDGQVVWLDDPSQPVS